MYLDLDLAKAIPPPPKDMKAGAGIATPKSSPADPKGPAASASKGPHVDYEYWSKGKGQPPADGGWEHTATGSWRRPKGSGGKKPALPAPPPKAGAQGQSPQVQPSKPVQQPQKQPSKPVQQPQVQPASPFSIKAKDFDGYSPQDHYKLSKYHEESGYDAGAVAHLAMARTKSKKLSSEEHGAMVNDLRANGMDYHADYHEKAAGAAQRSEQIKDRAKKPTKVAGSKNPAKDIEDATYKHSENTAVRDAKKKFSEEKKAKSAADKTAKMEQKTKDAEEKTVKDASAKANAGAAKRKENKSEGGVAESPEKEIAKAPSSPLEHATVSAHQSQAQELMDSLNSHAEASPSAQDAAKISNLIQALKAHVNIKTVPTKDQVKELNTIRKTAGEHSKAPKEDSNPAAPPVEPQEPGQHTPNLAGAFERGRAAGDAAGKAAVSPTGGGSLGTQAIQYASTGAVRTGHSLLKETDSENPKNKQSKSGEVSQSSMQAKSFSLYLDMFKAVTSPNVGSVTSDEKTRVNEAKASYHKEPSGLSGSEASDAEEDDDTDTEKSSEAVDSLKALSKAVRAANSTYLPTPMESEFMINELGYDPEAVRKGQAAISGRNRHLFTEWSNSRLYKSIESLSRLV